MNCRSKKVFAMQWPGIRHDNVCSRLHMRVPRASLLLVAGLTVFLFGTWARAENAPWSERIANSLLLPHPTAQPVKEVSPALDGETGFELQGLEAEWYNTANGEYYRRAKEIVDAVLQVHDGSGSDDQAAEAAGQLGRQLLLFYRVTLHENYYHAANQLRGHLAASCGISAEDQPAQPRNQMKHICAAEPFLAEFAVGLRQSRRTLPR